MPVVADYVDTGLVERFPTAILASSLMVLAALIVGIGMVMNAVLRSTRETRRLFYLQLPAMPSHVDVDIAAPAVVDAGRA